MASPRPRGPAFPSSYRNAALESAIAALLAEPTMDGFAGVLAAAGSGGLVVDVTGSPSATETRVRTIESTAGEPVLPLFTSMKALQEAAGAAAAASGAPGARIQAIVIPAREALALIRTAEFVAVQFNPGPGGVVVAREHIEGVLGQP